MSCSPLPDGGTPSEIHHGDAPPRPAECRRLRLALSPESVASQPCLAATTACGAGGRRRGDRIGPETYRTPLFVVDEDDSAAAAGRWRMRSAAAIQVHHAAKAFLCTEIARWWPRRWLWLGVASGGELGGRSARRIPRRAIASAAAVTTNRSTS